jgi:hypothetical protein
MILGLGSVNAVTDSVENSEEIESQEQETVQEVKEETVDSDL